MEPGRPRLSPFSDGFKVAAFLQLDWPDNCGGALADLRVASYSFSQGGVASNGEACWGQLGQRSAFGFVFVLCAIG